MIVLIWLKPELKRCLYLWAALSIGLSGCNEATEFAQKEQGSDTYVANAGSADSTVSYSYPAAKLADGEIAWDLSEGKVSHSFSLVKAPATLTAHQQLERTLYEEEKQQGYDGADANEPFNMMQTGQLDILIVMDNSNTMADWQDLVAERMDSLLSDISNTNWQIAVVSTDDPCVRGVVTRGEYDADVDAAKASFEALVKVGTNGSTNERGLEMAVKGFQPTPGCNGANNWTRQHSTKSVFLVSDEANCGSGELQVRDADGNPTGETYPERDRCTNGTYPDYTPERFVAEAPGVRFYGLLHDESDALCFASAGYDVQPDGYKQLTVDTGGLWRPICSASYDSILTEISADVGEQLVREFQLTATPDQGTFVALIDGVDKTDLFERPNGGRIVTLAGNIAGNPQNIEFIYQHGAKARFNSHTIANEAAADTIEVYVADQLVAADKYTVQEDGTIDFVDQPADKSQVKVKYRAKGNLENEFAVPEELWEGSLQVLVNGAAYAGQYEYDEINSQLIFANPPEDAATISFASRKDSDYQLEYILPARDLHAIRDIEIKATGGEDFHQAVNLDDGRLFFSKEDVEAYEGVEITYFLEQDSADFVISLGSEPLDGSLTVDAADEAVVSCLKEVAIKDNVVDASCFANANIASDKVAMTYKYVAQYYAQYALDLSVPVNANIQVFVDGFEVDFELVGRVVTIDTTLLEPNSIVDIVASK